MLLEARLKCRILFRWSEICMLPVLGWFFFFLLVSTLYGSKLSWSSSLFQALFLRLCSEVQVPTSLSHFHAYILQTAKHFVFLIFLY